MLRLGVVGCGRVTTMFHLGAIREVDGLELVAVVDRHRPRMEKISRSCGGARGYVDYSELLSDTEVDVVVINTPPNLHEEMVLRAIGAQKHVLCEKPLAATSDGGVRIKKAQEGTGLVVLPVHNYAFTPSLEHLRDIIAGGEFGGVAGVSVRFENNLRGYRSKTDFRLKSYYGIVEDVLPHVLSVTKVLAGTAKKVVEVKAWRKSFAVADNVSLRLITDREVPLDCLMSWTKTIPCFKVDVSFANGRASTDLVRSPFSATVASETGTRRVGEREGPRTYIDLLHFRHPSFARQYEHLRDVVEGAAEPRIAVDDEIAIIATMEEVVRHLSGGIENARGARGLRNSLLRDGVAVVKAGDDIADAVGRAVGLVGGLGLMGGEHVIIKPNICNPKNPGGMVLTDFRIIEAVIGMVNAKTNRITVVESDNISGTAERRMAESGLMSRLGELGVEFRNLSKDEAEVHRVAGVEIELPRTVLDADYLINIPKIKTCGHTLVTLSIKNLFGIIRTANKKKLHGKLDEILPYLAKVVRNDMIVVDGITAMEGNGPVVGTPRKLGLIVAGQNAVSVDSVCCCIMGFDVNDVPHLMRAHELGLGEVDLGVVDLLGDGLEGLTCCFERPYSLKASLRSIRSIGKVYLSR